MSAAFCHWRWVRIVVLVAACNFGAAEFYGVWATPGKDKKQAKRNAVWALYFSSSNCPRCDSVKRLVDSLKQKYRLRVQTYDLGNEKDYALFSALEAIHAADQFSVPLIIVGDSILMGERDIGEKLEPIVKKLAISGGASLPYIGKPVKTGFKPQPGSASREKKPSLSSGKEQRQLKVLIDKVN